MATLLTLEYCGGLSIARVLRTPAVAAVVPPFRSLLTSAGGRAAGR